MARQLASRPPTLGLMTKRNTAVLKIDANGIEYRAMLDLDDRNRAASAEIAAMLERMAGYIRRDSR